jgi:hypothetical protein
MDESPRPNSVASPANIKRYYQPHVLRQYELLLTLRVFVVSRSANITEHNEQSIINVIDLALNE